MEVALLLVGLVIGVLVTTAAAGRANLPAPLLLIAVGIAVSWVPAVPEVHLSHDVVLLGLLPPLLYAAAVQSSLVDFNVNRRSILLLSVGLVIFTALGVGVLVHWLMPGLPWAAAFALGAVVAPPDAVSATAIARRIGLPRRVVTILEGESLLNDATALVTLRTAIAATAGGLSVGRIGFDFLVAAGGGLLVGLVGFVVVGRIRLLLSDPPVLDTAISFVTPFAVYLAAEEMDASGVIAVVVCGLLLGHKAPIVQTAQARIAERTNWRTVAYLLENSVFLLIGLQARWILDDVERSSLGTGRIVVVCVATVVAVIVLRLAWLFPVRALLLRPLRRHGRHVAPLASTFLIGWSGMRGVVTLAAAFLIPAGTPHREVLLLIAFSVVVGTLFVQGLTLPTVARLLNVPSPDVHKDALVRADLLQQASTAGLRALDRVEEPDPHDVRQLIRDRVQQRSLAAWERLGPVDAETPSEAYSRMRRIMINAERAWVLRARDSGGYAHEVVQDVLAMLDVEESMLERSQTKGRELRMAMSETEYVDEGACAHLRVAPSGVTPQTTEGCQDCLAQGTTWVHLRLCLTCGHVGCCDSSPQRHATAHFHGTDHPVMRSFEEGEDWRWCYVDEVTG